MAANLLILLTALLGQWSIRAISGAPDPWRRSKIAAVLHKQEQPVIRRGVRGGAIMDSSSLVTVLNEPVETSRDGERGFQACVAAVENPDLRRLFQDMAQSCTQAIGELEREIRAAGGDPSEGGSTAGAMHRGWVNVKSTIMGRDETAVFAECERGEDIAKRSYQEALQAKLPEQVRRMVARQYEGLTRNHDRVRDLRDASVARSRRSKSRAGSSVRGGASNVSEAGLD